MAHLVSTDRELLLTYGRAVGLPADRLQFKRLANFTLERLPSPAEDVYLVLAKARENPEEERTKLFLSQIL